MNPQPNPEVVIFNAALELPAGQREAYLQKACAGEPALRLQIEALLRVHEQADAFLEPQPPAAQKSAIDGEACGVNKGLGFAPFETDSDCVGR